MWIHLNHVGDHPDIGDLESLKKMHLDFDKKQTYVFGRGVSCDFTLFSGGAASKNWASMVLSREHAKISYDSASGKFLLTDISRNGTYRNGVSLMKGTVPIENGDVIRFGESDGSKQESPFTYRVTINNEAPVSLKRTLSPEPTESKKAKINNDIPVPVSSSNSQSFDSPSNPLKPVLASGEEPTTTRMDSIPAPSNDSKLVTSSELPSEPSSAIQDAKRSQSPARRIAARKNSVDKTSSPALLALFSCGICNGVVVDNVTTSCGHNFCRKCLNSKVKSTLELIGSQSVILRCPIKPCMHVLCESSSIASLGDIDCDYASVIAISNPTLSEIAVQLNLRPQTIEEIADPSFNSVPVKRVKANFDLAKHIATVALSKALDSLKN